MCLAIPGRILEKWTEGAAPFANADFNGNVRRISLAFLPDLEIGEYTIIHAGFALSKVSQQQVDEVMAQFEESGLLETEDSCL